MISNQFLQVWLPKNAMRRSRRSRRRRKQELNKFNKMIEKTNKSLTFLENILIQLSYKDLDLKFRTKINNRFYIRAKIKILLKSNPSFNSRIIFNLNFLNTLFFLVSYLP